MPFDGTESEQSISIVPVIDRMIDLLSDKDHWTKHNAKILGRAGYAYCLMGALRESINDHSHDGGQQIVNQLADVIIKQNKSFFFTVRKEAIVIAFNDSPRTTHKMIMTTLHKTRKRSLPRTSFLQRTYDFIVDIARSDVR